MKDNFVDVSKYGFQKLHLKNKTEYKTFEQMGKKNVYSSSSKNFATKKLSLLNT